MQNFPFDDIAVSDIKSIIPIRPKYSGEVDNYPGFWFSILVYRYSGRTRYHEPDGNEFDFCQDEILYIPAHYPYVVKKNEIGRSCVINFEQSNKNEIVDRIYRFRINDTEKLRELFEKIEELWERKGIGYRNECMAVLYEIFSLIEQKNVVGASCPRRKEMLMAKEYIDEHYIDPDADLSCAALARLCGISQGHFNKLFYAFFRTSPRQYICEKRLYDAECMMLSGNHNIGEIAAECGFGTVHYFSRYFRKKKGMSPSEYLGSH